MIIKYFDFWEVGKFMNRLMNKKYDDNDDKIGWCMNESFNTYVRMNDLFKQRLHMKVQKCLNCMC